MYMPSSKEEGKPVRENSVSKLGWRFDSSCMLPYGSSNLVLKSKPPLFVAYASDGEYVGGPVLQALVSAKYMVSYGEVAVLIFPSSDPWKCWVVEMVGIKSVWGGCEIFRITVGGRASAEALYSMSYAESFWISGAGDIRSASEVSWPWL